MESLNARTVVLTVASAHTSEKLRNLVTLLIRHHVREITVLCLLNRMGRQTAEFIRSIQGFVGGVEFHFVAVYNLPDLRSEDIVRMQSTTLRRLAGVGEATPVPNFKRLVVEYSKYFRARSVSSPRFQLDDPDPLETPELVRIADEILEVRSQQGKLFALCCDLIVSNRRSYSHVIAELVETTDKRTRFFLLGVVLSNLQYLHGIGEYEELRNRLVERIRGLQRQRIGLERGKHAWSLTDNELRSIRWNIELEVQYVFCLALSCFLDLHFDYVEFARDYLCAGLHPSALKESPQNFLIYFTDDRVLWCVSLILHLSRPSRRQKLDGAAFTSITQTVHLLIVQIEHLHRDPGSVPIDLLDIVTTDCQAAKSTLQLLLSDLGNFRMRSGGEVIRYLHKELIVPKKRHNPIDSTLSLVTGKLQELLTGPLGEIADRNQQRIALKTWCGGDDNEVRRLQEWLDQGRRTAQCLRRSLTSRFGCLALHL